MNSLESLARGTPEFQNLTPKQQEERMQLLSIMLHIILEQPSPLGITQEQAVRFGYDFVEFCFTGKIERVTEEQKTPGKHKR